MGCLSLLIGKWRRKKVTERPRYLRSLTVSLLRAVFE